MVLPAFSLPATRRASPPRGTKLGRFQGRVPETWTERPPMPVPSAFTPSNVVGRSWTGVAAAFALPRLGPAFGEGERAGAEGLALALALPRLALGLVAIDGQPRAERRDEQGADAVSSRVGTLIGLGMNQQRFADVVPGERDLGIGGRNVLGPEIARVARLLEGGIGDRDCDILELGIEHALHGFLQPAGHRDVVGVDSPAALGQLALDVEHVPGPHRAVDDPPVAGVGRIGVAILGAEPDERVLARQDGAIGICNTHSVLPFRNSKSGSGVLRP